MITDFDLIIIGGGINGAGIARDAAERGMRVCLLEQGDLCNGTTRWSSRLIHGGLRYLEHAELGLVYESLHERETLLRIAPHLVQPLKLLIPIYKSGRRSKFLIAVGMGLYDLLSIGKSLPNHKMLDAREALEELPALNHHGLAGAATYFDAQVTFAERLVVENALAAREAGAQIRTYSRVDQILSSNRLIGGVRYTDLRSDRQYDLSAPVVVNAAGPWVDRVLEKMSQPPRRFMGGTKGTHIVVPRFPGQPKVACYLEAESDGRPFFILPWNNMLLIGTTDIRFDGNPGEVCTEEAEISYLLSETNRVFPDAKLDKKSIHFHYTGVRPLPRKEKKAEGDITRRHIIKHHRRNAKGFYSVIGGKLTTYRNLAEEVTDRVVRRLKHHGAKCQTARQPLPGAAVKISWVVDQLDNCDYISPESRVHLLNVYGSRALLIRDLVKKNPRLGDEICPHSHAIAAEIIFVYEHEMPTTLADVLLRRTMIGLSPDQGRAALPKALDIARHHIGWSAARADEEERRYLREIGRLMC
ncbi:MAG: glycerol-3-phosphate dehydrogenase [Gammaproteobacteria bacterium]|nr:MAG: glycerol-3-phosphate dehydrogenase [Gammaproteobacteria bacterium]